MKRFCFLLLAAAGMIALASYAGEPVLPDPEHCVIVPGEHALFVGSTNDLSPWAGETTPRKYRLTVFDRVGKKAVGYIGSAGRKEELGPELVCDGGMEIFTKKGRLSSLWWGKDRCEVTMETESLRPGTEGKAAAKVTVVNGKNPWGANAGNINETIPIENDRLHKLSGWLKNGPESDCVFLVFQGIATGTQIETPHHKGKEWKEYVLYFVPSQVPILSEEVWFYLFVIGADGAFGYGDDIFLREVVSGGRNTVKIYPDRAGDRQGWGVVEAGFNPGRVSKCLVEEVN